MATKKENRALVRRRTRRVLNTAGDEIKSVGKSIHRRNWGRGLCRTDL